MVPYLCSRFHIFNRPMLEEYVFQVEETPHLLKSYFHAAQNSLPPELEMHPSFESSVVTNNPSLHIFFMEVHHDTSFRSILEDDSISLAFRARICFCSSKGVGLWLIARPFICSFYIAQSTFILALCFCLSLI